MKIVAVRCPGGEPARPDSRIEAGAEQALGLRAVLGDEHGSSCSSTPKAGTSLK